MSSGTVTTNPKPAQSCNPKDLIGSTKVPLSLVSPIALLHEACALKCGADKYNPWNWRAQPVSAQIYVDACLRHLHAWNQREELSDEGVHHLGHARACLGILLDAMETGNLVDDRPVAKSGDIVYAQVLDRLNKWVSSRQESAKRQALIDLPVRVEDASKDFYASFKGYIDEASQDHTGTDFAPRG